MSIVVRDLSYRYPYSERDVIQGVDLRVDRGEFVLLVGRSGCGKTTLARCLNGLIPHVFQGELRGSVLVDGVSVAETPVYELAKHVGMVFQNPDTQLCTLTVEEEVAFGPENLGVERGEIERRVNWALSSLGIQGLRRRATFSLSDGEKQKVAVASALSMLPSILVLDEPTANLDPRASRMLVDALRTLRDEYGTTIVLVEHRVERFAEVVDRVVVMASGRIIESGSPDIVTRKAEVLERLSVQTPEIVEVCRALGLTSKRSPEELRRLALEKLARLKEGEAKFPTHSTERGKGEPILEVRDAVYDYGGGFTLRVNELELYRGEVVSIVGGNGSGKTTLAKLLVGLIKPKRGRVERAKNLRLGMVFQNSEVQLFNKSVFNEVAFQLRRRKASPEETRRRVNKVLDLMGLRNQAERHPHSLSQGEKQRVTLASLIAEEPDVLVLDEPTTGQDWYHLGLLVDAVERLRERGVTVVLITHDLRFAARTAERTVILNNGEIVEVGDARKAFYNVEEKTGFEPPETVKLSKKVGLKNLIRPEDIREFLEAHLNQKSPLMA